MTTTWRELIDDFERTVVRVEDALATDGDMPPLATFAPPAVLPSHPPSRDELTRFRQLEIRSRTCLERVRAAMARTVAELDASRRIGAAARAYGEVGYLPGR